MADRLGMPNAEERRTPFAIGVLAVPWGLDRIAPGDVAAERLSVAIAAYEAGYFLLDVLEVPGVDRPDGIDGDHDGDGDGDAAGDSSSAWARVWGLAAATDAEAFVVRGAVDRDRLEAFAAELRVLVRDGNGPPVSAAAAAVVAGGEG